MIVPPSGSPSSVWSCRVCALRQDRVSNPENLPGRLTARWHGIYALRLSYPTLVVTRTLRRYSRRLRSKTSRHEQPTHLPSIAWADVLKRRKISLTDVRKHSGNVTLAELGILAQAAATIPPGSEIIEIGTFNGRTAANMVRNAPAGSMVFTLDLPEDHPTRFQLDKGEDVFVRKERPHSQFRDHPGANRIIRLFGDSAVYDWSPHVGKAGLVFVDGSHAYDYVCADSRTAQRLVQPGGMVLWHDYGVWEGVTRALEELERCEQLGLKHIRGTSLVFWRNGDR